MIARSCGEESSTSETSRARARGSLARAAATSASGLRSARPPWPARSARPAAEPLLTDRSGTVRSGSGSSRNAEQQRVPLTAAAAQRGRAEPAATAAQLVDEMQRDPGAGGAERMPDGNGPAVDVDDVRIDAEVSDRLKGDGRERLVDLDEVQVRYRQPGLVQGALDSARG